MVPVVTALPHQAYLQELTPLRLALAVPLELRELQVGPAVVRFSIFSLVLVVAVVGSAQLLGQTVTTGRQVVALGEQAMEPRELVELVFLGKVSLAVTVVEIDLVLVVVVPQRLAQAPQVTRP